MSYRIPIPIVVALLLTACGSPLSQRASFNTPREGPQLAPMAATDQPVDPVSPEWVSTIGWNPGRHAGSALLAPGFEPMLVRLTANHAAAAPSRLVAAPKMITPITIVPLPPSPIEDGADRTVGQVHRHILESWARFCAGRPLSNQEDVLVEIGQEDHEIPATCRHTRKRVIVNE